MCFSKISYPCSHQCVCQMRLYRPVAILTRWGCLQRFCLACFLHRSFCRSSWLRQRGVVLLGVFLLFAPAVSLAPFFMFQTWFELCFQSRWSKISMCLADSWQTVCGRYGKNVKNVMIVVLTGLLCWILQRAEMPAVVKEWKRSNLMAASTEVKLKRIHLMMLFHTHMTPNVISVSQLLKFRRCIFLWLMCACWPERDLDTGVVHGCERTKTE